MRTPVTGLAPLGQRMGRWCRSACLFGAIGIALSQPGCGRSPAPVPSASGGSGQQAGAGGSGGSSFVSICGPQGGLSIEFCTRGPECGSVLEDGEYVPYSFRIENPLGENCSCEYRPAWPCPLGCDDATGECVVEGLGGSAGEGGGAGAAPT